MLTVLPDKVIEVAVNVPTGVKVNCEVPPVVTVLDSVIAVELCTEETVVLDCSVAPVPEVTVSVANTKELLDPKVTLAELVVVVHPLMLNAVPIA